MKMGFILIIVSSYAYFIPSFTTITEFSTLDSCEIALAEANKQYATVERLSKCIDVKKEKERIKKRKELLDEAKKLK